MDKFKDDGAKFADVERRLSLYLRALWGREIRLRPLIHGKGPTAGRRATLDGDLVRLPHLRGDSTDGGAPALLRAAAAHAAAHVAFTRRRFPVAELSALQVALVSLVEDARVERLAMNEFPGLKRLWAPFHATPRGDSAAASSLMARLSRALIDHDYEDEDPWVKVGRRLFLEQRGCWEDQSISRTIGGMLGDDLEEMRLRFSFGTYLVEPAYRDDNMGIWDFASRHQSSEDDESVNQGARLVGGDEGEQRQGEAQGDAPDRDGSGVKLSAALGQREATEEALSSPIRYDEWDYLIGRDRPAWCTLLEKPAAEGDWQRIDDVLERNHELVDRVKYLVRAVQVQRPSRLKRRLDGDRLDLDASIDATVDLRSSLPPDPRVYSILGRKQRDLSVLVLLDVSQSTNDIVPGTGATVLDLAREATALLADAMDRIGDNFAIHGFSSNGRHDVGYYRFKDFDRPYGELAKSRLAGMTGQLSTRMGTALRHSGSYLKQRRAHGKLVLLITDGEPSDIDVHDSQYLVFDARKAVEGLSRLGIYTYCMSLDPKADRYVSRIFGVRNWTVVDRLRRLPEKLPLLYMRLTH